MLRNWATKIARRFQAPSPPSPQKKKKVVVVGTGWGGFRVAMDLDKSIFDVIVVSPRNHFLFTPLLPSTAVGTLEFRAIQEPVRSIPDINFYLAKVESIDFIAKKVACVENLDDNCKFSVDFDYLVLATGCDSNTFNVSGVMNNDRVFFLKQLRHARQIRNKIIECFEHSMNPSIPLKEKKEILTFVIVGGGPTNIEFAAELYDFIQKDVVHYYGQDLVDLVSVTVVEASDHILGSFNSSIVSYVENIFKHRKVNVLTSLSVKEVKGNVAILSNGTTLAFGAMVWNTGLKPNPLIGSLSNLSKSKNGRLEIDGGLRVLHVVDSKKTVACDGQVFSLGDCACNVDKPLPQLAQVAMQQAKFLANSLNSGEISSKSNSDVFKYYHLGSMASVGDWKGVYDASNLGSDSTYFSAVPVKGFLAFVLWRSAYWTKQVSIVNKILIPMYWFKSAIFGRDISQF